ncbi:MAG: radical SAM protein [Deltaproteobacteria bacterium]|nr:radical SAM protein [Deltaproteobacteria bacterium]
MCGAQHRKIVLVYVGDEQLSWARQAFSEARHYYVMPGILYLGAMLKARADEIGAVDVECVYFNRAVHDFDAMVEALEEKAPSLLGLSCYSWNISENLALARELKSRQIDRVMLGGPEVSFAREEEALEFMEANPMIDALVLGEGEGVIADVAAALLGDGGLREIPGVVIRKGARVIAGPRNTEPVDLSTVPQINPAAAQVPRTPGTGLAIVYQTYRGCPYSCAYCSFHGGAKGIRRFPMGRIERELRGLFHERVELLNFADAVFDISKQQAKRILRICAEHNIETSLLCYAAFQGMDEELADLLEKTRIQVGIGLQSVHEDVLKTVSRRFSVSRFFDAIDTLGGRKINFYVDLMYGLPADSPVKFEKTFNDVMALGPPFVMPFPLTVIPRSELAGDLPGYRVIRFDDEELARSVRPTSGMVYADIGLGENFSLRDLRRFDDLATAVFFTFQRYPRTLQMLCDYSRKTRDRGHDMKPFDVFEQTGRRIRQDLGGEPIDVKNPPLLDGAMRETFFDLLEAMGAGDVERDVLKNLIKLEAVISHLLGSPGRRTAYRSVRERGARELDIDAVGSVRDGSVALKGPSRLVRLPFSFDDMAGLSEIREHAKRKDLQGVVFAPYDDWMAHIVEVGNIEAAIVEELPASREMRLLSLERRLKRLPGGDTWRASLTKLVNKGIVGFYWP